MQNPTPESSRTQPGPVLGFGKFGDRPLPFVPLAYLRWAITIIKSRDLAVAVRLELDRREARPAVLVGRPRPNGSRIVGHVIRPPAPGEPVPF